jgi:hypothetical protein
VRVNGEGKQHCANIMYLCFVVFSSYKNNIVGAFVTFFCVYLIPQLPFLLQFGINRLFIFENFNFLGFLASFLL